MRDWQQRRLLVPSVLLIGPTITIGFALPLLPNSDVAFQGLNVWHSLQYLALVIHWMFGVALQQAYYIVILSTLLQHYYLDHLQFTKLGDMLGAGDRLLAGRA